MSEHTSGPDVHNEVGCDAGEKVDALLEEMLDVATHWKRWRERHGKSPEILKHALIHLARSVVHESPGVVLEGPRDNPVQATEITYAIQVSFDEGKTWGWIKYHPREYRNPTDAFRAYNCDTHQMAYSVRVVEVERRALRTCIKPGTSQ